MAVCCSASQHKATHIPSHWPPTRLLPCLAGWLQEETGGFVDETHNPFLSEEGDPLLKKREEQMQVRALLAAAGLWFPGCCIWCLAQDLAGVPLLMMREEGAADAGGGCR